MNGRDRPPFAYQFITHEGPCKGKLLKKLRVAVIAPQPFVEHRGTPMANLRLVQTLADAGHAVDIITYPYGEPLDYPGLVVRRCRSLPFTRSVKIGFSAAKVLLDISLAVCAAGLIRNGRYDCIHAVEEAAFFGVLLSRSTGLPLIYDMDSVISHEMGYTFLRRFPPVIWFTRSLEKWAVRNASLVMTISDSMAEYAGGIDREAAIVAVPDIPILSSTEGPDPSRAQLPPGLVGRPIIMYTGSLAVYQGLDLLLDSFRRVIEAVPDVALVVVGGGEKDVRRLVRRAETAGLINDVAFLGKRPPEIIPDLLSAADVLVSPRRGGINPPAKIYTYMQSGRPIVATDVPAHTSVLGRDAAFLARPDAEGIAEGLVAALSHPEEGASKAARARQIVSEITPELQVSRILAGYEIIINKIEEREETNVGNR